MKVRISRRIASKSYFFVKTPLNRTFGWLGKEWSFRINFLCTFNIFLFLRPEIFRARIELKLNFSNECGWFPSTNISCLLFTSAMFFWSTKRSAALWIPPQGWVTNFVGWLSKSMFNPALFCRRHRITYMMFGHQIFSLRLKHLMTNYCTLWINCLVASYAWHPYTILYLCQKCKFSFNGNKWGTLNFA